MAKARFAQSRVVDTTGIGVSPNSIENDYVEVDVPVSDLSKKPKGINERDKRKFTQKSQLNTDNDYTNRDEFDLERAYDLT